jgi:iron complex outermembrane receptor protein
MNRFSAARPARLSLAALLAATVLSPIAAGPAFAQEASEDEAIIVTGTRAANRSALSTASPVDVIAAEDLSQLGVAEVNQALAVALPSFNFPRPGLADGTDTIRPATLRGLSPDQTLVLLNSKRRHAASLVNVNGTVGRGSSAVDLNTIPTAAVGSIEVLRDGASALYGSDAIAGVINVRLREASSGGGLTLSYGQRRSTVETLVGNPPAGAGWSVANLASYDVEDGETVNINGWIGFPLGSQGFLTLAAEYLDQQETIRTAPDWRQQYPLVSGAFDPRELTINRYNAWYGEPRIEQITAFANAGYDLANGAELYGWASYQNRDSTSAGFFRRALDDRNVIQIYPDGFLPLINPEVTDLSAAGGVRFDLAGWDMDTSLVYGSNEMAFTIRNTLNRSIGPSSKTVFDAGGFEYEQLVFNFGGVRSFTSNLEFPINLAVGVEARREGYSIFAGEPDSYRNGGVLLNGAPTASGAQVFPGFRPSNEVDEERDAIGFYVDAETNITANLQVGLAVRAEHYSDFGETLTGRFSARYDFNDWFAVRGSVQNGFRAPSLQQQFFTATSTNFINGVPFDITTFPVSDPVARALGAQELRAEESTNVALGAVFRVQGFSVTVDAYQIEVTDRIVLSENLTAANVRTFLTSQGFIGIGGGRFFINGVDTTTEGVDVVANWSLDETPIGDFDFTFGANWNSTDVTRVPQTAQLSALSPAPVLFDRINVLTFEEGTPKDKFSLNVDWEYGLVGATFRATRYGDVLSPGTSAANDLVLDAATLIDIEGRLDLFDTGVRLAIGADNVTDEYPTQTPASLNGTSNTPFSNYSPFGRSGRFVYARLSYGW